MVYLLYQINLLTSSPPCFLLASSPGPLSISQFLMLHACNIKAGRSREGLGTRLASCSILAPHSLPLIISYSAFRRFSFLVTPSGYVPFFSFQIHVCPLYQCNVTLFFIRYFQWYGALDLKFMYIVIFLIWYCPSLIYC